MTSATLTTTHSRDTRERAVHTQADRPLPTIATHPDVVRARGERRAMVERVAAVRGKQVRLQTEHDQLLDAHRAAAVAEAVEGASDPDASARSARIRGLELDLTVIASAVTAAEQALELQALAAKAAERQAMEDVRAQLRQEIKATVGAMLPAVTELEQLHGRLMRLCQAGQLSVDAGLLQPLILLRNWRSAAGKLGISVDEVR